MAQDSSKSSSHRICISEKEGGEGVYAPSTLKTLLGSPKQHTVPVSLPELSCIIMGRCKGGLAWDILASSVASNDEGENVYWEAAEQLCCVCTVVYLSSRKILGWKERCAYVPHRTGMGLLGVEKHSKPHISLLHYFPPFMGCGKLPFPYIVLENYEETLASHRGISVCVLSQNPLLLSFNKC